MHPAEPITTQRPQVCYNKHTRQVEIGSNHHNIQFLDENPELAYRAIEAIIIRLQSQDRLITHRQRLWNQIVATGGTPVYNIKGDPIDAKAAFKFTDYMAQTIYFEADDLTLHQDDIMSLLSDLPSKDLKRFYSTAAIWALQSEFEECRKVVDWCGSEWTAVTRVHGIDPDENCRKAFFLQPWSDECGCWNYRHRIELC